MLEQMNLSSRFYLQKLVRFLCTQFSLLRHQHIPSIRDSSKMDQFYRLEALTSQNISAASERIERRHLMGAWDYF